MRTSVAVAGGGLHARLGPHRGARATLAAGLVAALITALLTLVPVPAAAQGDDTGQTLDLRVLVIAGDASTDANLALIEEVLVETGAAYTVLDSSNQDLTADFLFDGPHGFFNGVILTDAELFVPPDTSGFTVPEWELLQEYERTFGVREAVMSGSPSDVSPALDYGLEEVFADRGIVGRWTLPEGSEAFRYVNTETPFPISDYAVASLPTGSGPAVTPLLVDESDPARTLISILDYDDGRKVLFSSIANAGFLVHSRVLAYEFVRFATSGLHLGAHRIFLTMHVDDLFLGSAVWNSEGSFSDGSVPYRNEVADIDAVIRLQRDLDERYPVLDDLRLELAFNGLGSPATNTGDLEILADAAVAEGLPNRRYGRSGTLRAGRTNTGLRMALYRFDATPPPTDVGTVLRLTRADDGPVRGSVCALTQAWSEDEVTWAEAARGTPWDGEGGPAVDDGSCVSFDLERSSDPIEIRSLIERWNDGGDNHGVAVRIDGRSLSAPSRESGAGAVLHYGTAPTLPDPLTDHVVGRADDLVFLNHTFTHRDLDVSNATGRGEAYFEISRNIQAWAQLGLPGLDDNRRTLVTGQHSGLSEDQGTFFDQSDDIFFPDGANPGLLDAMEELGIRYVAGDSSRPNQMVEQYVPDRDIVLLPRYPATVFFDVRTPEEMTAEYNFLFHQNYLDQGLDPCVEPGARCEPVDYATIVTDESRLALLRLLSGKSWPHYFHITNIVDYDGAGRTLVGDWVTALLDRYEALMTLPIESPLFNEIGARAEARLALAEADLAAVLDRDRGTVTLLSDRDLTFEVSGLAGGEAHGGVPVQTVSLSAGTQLEFDPAPVGAEPMNSTPVADTTLAELTPERSVGGARSWVSAGPAAQQALLQFVLPERAGELISATLRLRDVRVAGTTAVPVEVCTVVEPADAATATWTETGAGSTWAAGAGAAGSDAACVAARLRHGEDAIVDVTALAAGVLGGSSNYGVVVRTTTGSASFGSFESDHPPILVTTTQQ